MLALPLLIPLVIAAARATSPLLEAAGAGALPGRWLVVLGLYDLVFGLLAFAVFDFLLEDCQTMFARGLKTPLLVSVVLIVGAFALVFFYAPNDADQGFIQKIFYLHVPLAIVALCGFVAGGVCGIQYLRTGDRAHDLRSYVAIHLSLILAVARADHRLDLGQGRVGALVGVGRADARLVPDRLPALRVLPAAAVLDRGPRAPGALRRGVLDRRGRVRAAELHRRADSPSRSRTRAC